MGRSKGGAFRCAPNLSAHLMREVLSRNPALDAAEIDDIYWGCVQQTLEQGFNIARNAALLAEITPRAGGDRQPPVRLFDAGAARRGARHHGWRRKRQPDRRRGTHGPCADESALTSIRG
ncbi:hypothetical protein M8494_35390 [Serratia ureilytica]